MFAIFLAIFFTAISVFVYKNALVSVTIGILCALSALAANYICKPLRRGTEFSDEDFELTDVFPLDALQKNKEGRPVYVLKGTTKKGESFVLFKSIGRNNKPSEIRQIPSEIVHVIFDEEPHVRLYAADRYKRGNFFMSVFKTHAVKLLIELHTPDSFAAFSKDRAL